MKAQVTITAANSAAAKEMIQEIAKAAGANFENYKIKPFGLMVGGKGKNRVDHYSSTDGKISYCEAYENGELDRVNFFNEDDDFVATIQVADGGAEKITDAEISEICKVLGIEPAASKADEEIAPVIEPETTAEDDGSNDDADEPAYVSATPKFSNSDEDDDLADEYWTVATAPKETHHVSKPCEETAPTDSKPADGEIEEIEVINPAVFAPAPSDKLLKIRGCIFTHSQYTFEEIAEYLDKIEACDAGADHIQAGSNEWLIEEFSDDYMPSEYAVTFEGECLMSTLELIQAKVKSFDTPDRYSPRYAVLKYDAEPVEDDDDEDSEPEPPTEPAEEIPAHIADKIAYCNKLLTAQTCRPKYFLGAMEDLQAMLDGNPAAIDAYKALVERYNEIVHAKGGDFLDCLSPIRADLDEITTAEPTCDTSVLHNYDEPELATDSNTEQEETTLENENISTILHQVQHAEDVAKNTIREFFKVADSYSDNTPEDNDMAALYRMFAGEVYKIWREINKVRKTTGALLKNTTTATQAPDDTPPLCTTTAIPFTGLLSEQTWLYMSQSTFENYLAGKKWHAHIPEITAKDAAAALNILRQITTTEYRVTHTYHGEFGERQEYCKGDNGVDILKWYSPTYTNHPEHSDELMSIVFFRNDTPVAQIHIPTRWLNDRLVFEGDRESLTAEQIAEVQEFLGLPPQEQVTEMPTLKISKAPAGESTTFKISQNPRDDEPANNSIDSETPATETTILSPPLDSTALTKDLADTVLEVKIAADEIEEMLAGGYDLSDSGCNSISKAQELLRQALAELGKLKSTDSAA